MPNINLNEPATDVVNRTAREILTAFEPKDAVKATSYYAPDPVSRRPTVPRLKDAGAVSKAISDDLADPNFKMNLSHEKTDVAASGDLRYRRGSYAVTATNPQTKQVA